MKRKSPKPMQNKKTNTSSVTKKKSKKKPILQKDSSSSLRSDNFSSSTIRLQKFLADAGVASRRKCEEYIQRGLVTVDNEIVTELGTTVDPTKQKIEFEGQLIRPEKKVYFWVYKPKGVISTTNDEQNRPTVLDLVPSKYKRMYPVGRLDEESTGLMLLTNDGELAQRLTHPKYGVSKTYEITVAGIVPWEVIEKLRKGVWLSEGKARVASMKKLGTSGKSTRFQIILKEGLNREIRRVFARFGHKVLTLKRIAIANLKIRSLKMGQSRPLKREEIAALHEAAFNRTPHEEQSRPVKSSSSKSGKTKFSKPKKSFKRSEKSNSNPKSTRKTSRKFKSTKRS